ncbi:hypothetical protein NECAME_16916 [Necator americanus]|uniref:Secreted protein n=1 Tax=Necator americanus TaxID=51031 RepID=W2TTH3_NECAM|nr:hypothetical protein NECAME_16916 [Necator americanus]ETN85088.1 hypothetical protein NECAME_16916 [Necator americanus]
MLLLALIQTPPSVEGHPPNGRWWSHRDLREMRTPFTDESTVGGRREKSTSPDAHTTGHREGQGESERAGREH